MRGQAVLSRICPCVGHGRPKVRSDLRNQLTAGLRLQIDCAFQLAKLAMTVQILLIVLGVLLILIGIAGTIIPALPGVPVVYLGMVLVAWGDDFSHIGWPTLTILGVLTVIAVVVDLIASILGAKRVGASGWALFGAAVGTVVGLFFGIIGLLLGPFVGAVLGELIAGSNLQRSTVVGVGAWIGFLLGTVARIGLCFAMLGVFAAGFIF